MILIRLLEMPAYLLPGKCGGYLGERMYDWEGDDGEPCGDECIGDILKKLAGAVKLTIEMQKLFIR